MKPLPIVIALTVIAVSAWFVFTGMDERPPDIPAPAVVRATPASDAPADNPTTNAPSDDPRGARREGDEGRSPPPPDAIAFEKVPEAHRPEAVLPKVRVIGESLNDQFAHANVEMLDTECVSAPCILGFDYDSAAVAAGEGGARGFHEAVRATFEATLGYPVTSMHIDNIDDGKQIWMFAVPAEVDRADPFRNQLIETGHHRHATLVGDLPSPDPEKELSKGSTTE
jgi:hypothetical protein